MQGLETRADSPGAFSKIGGQRDVVGVEKLTFVVLLVGFLPGFPYQEKLSNFSISTRKTGHHQ